MRALLSKYYGILIECRNTQYFYSKRNLNPLRAVLWNAAMVEGWAVYGEGLMVQLGWGGEKSDRFRFYDLRGRMIVATNILLDIKLNSGQMTDAEAVHFMVEQGFLGLDEIESLERDYKNRPGKKWSQREFNEALIGHGSVAVKFLRWYLLGE